MARKAVRRNRKRKNMAVKLFGADRDVVDAARWLRRDCHPHYSRDDELTGESTPETGRTALKSHVTAKDWPPVQSKCPSLSLPLMFQP